MKITHKIDIHLDKYRPEAEIVVMQCDANTRELQFTLYSNNVAWPIPEAAKIYVGYSKPDGTGGFYDTLPDGVGACTVESNTVTAVLAEQVLTVPGKVFVSVSLQEEGQILATFAVQLNVKPKPGIAVMQSENYFCLKALIDAATVAAQKPVQVITVSENADGGYVSSHYLSGIQSIINLQLPVACHWREKNVTLYLAEYQNGGPFTFAAVSNAIEYRVVIKSDEDISCTMTKLAGSDAIPTKVSQLQNDSGFLTEAPVTTTKVELTKQTDGSYLSDLSAADIMAAYKDHKTVHCYHNKMILPLIRSVVNDAVFGGIYDGQIHTVTVASNRVATVTVIPLASGGGSDGITPHIGANGNWWIGEEDTGVSAGVTDEQISGAVEEYLEENPLVKTVNGTEPDENGNVVLDIPSGGGSSESGAFYFTVILEEDVSPVNLLMPVNWERIIQFNIHADTKGNNLTADMSWQTEIGGSYNSHDVLKTDLKGLNVYGIRSYSGDDRTVFAIGRNASYNSHDTATPVIGNLTSAPRIARNNFMFISVTEGVMFPKGMRFDVWGVYGP